MTGARPHDIPVFDLYLFAILPLALGRSGVGYSLQRFYCIISHTILYHTLSYHAMLDLMMRFDAMARHFGIMVSTYRGIKDLDITSRMGMSFRFGCDCESGSGVLGFGVN